MDYTKIMERLTEYRDDRDWENSHTTKKLTTSICIKAANLLETFQWKGDEELIQKNEKTEIEENVADILISLLYLCRNLDITTDNIEATIYSRIIKESTNMHLTGQQSNIHNSKVIEFKNIDKILIFSLISSKVFYNLFPTLLNIAELAQMKEVA